MEHASSSLPSAHASSAPVWLRATADGCELDVVVQPRASRSRVIGVHDGRLKVQLAAPPVDGEANAELLALFASLLGVAKRELMLLRGDTSRRKTVAVHGVAHPQVLRALLGEGA